MEKTANFKVGDKVRILDVTEIYSAERAGYETGGIYPVVEIDKHGDPIISNGEEELCFFRGELKYLEKVSSKPTKNQRITALEETVEQLKARVEQLGALVEAQQSVNTTQVIAKALEKYNAKVAELTPNQKRKAIIDEAKAFVETEGNTNYVACHYEYHVNVEKRTVVALRIGNHSDTVRARGIAKCAPDDVFNADIGKAIALGRALGLDVERFEQAVKPTEFAVGQSFEWDTSYDTRIETITEIKKGSAYVKNGGWFWLTRAQQSNYRIIDDTEAQYV